MTQAKRDDADAFDALLGQLVDELAMTPTAEPEPPPPQPTPTPRVPTHTLPVASPEAPTVAPATAAMAANAVYDDPSSGPGVYPLPQSSRSKLIGLGIIVLGVSIISAALIITFGKSDTPPPPVAGQIPPGAGSMVPPAPVAPGAVPAQMQPAVGQPMLQQQPGMVQIPGQLGQQPGQAVQPGINPANVLPGQGQVGLPGQNPTETQQPNSRSSSKRKSRSSKSRRKSSRKSSKKSSSGTSTENKPKKKKKKDSFDDL